MEKRNEDKLKSVFDTESHKVKKEVHQPRETAIQKEFKERWESETGRTERKDLYRYIGSFSKKSCISY